MVLCSHHCLVSSQSVERRRIWRSSQRVRRPTDGTIVHRLGPWTQAVRSVGGRTVSYTSDDCLQALRSAARDLGLADLRQGDYQAWAAEAPDRPEKQAIRYHLGPWREALGAALSEGVTPLA